MYIKLGGPWGPMGAIPMGPQVLYTQLIFYIFKKSLKYKVFPLYFFQELNGKLSQLERVRFSQDFFFFLNIFDIFSGFYLFGIFSIFGHRKIMKKSLFRQKRPFWAYFSFQRPVPVHTGSLWTVMNRVSDSAGSGSHRFRLPVPVQVLVFPVYIFAYLFFFLFL